MRRREFIAAVTGAATWPLIARAQRERVRLVGVLAGFSEEEMRPLLAAFRSRMSQLGWIEGRNLAIDVRLTAGEHQRATAEAGALVGRNPDVIVAMGTPTLAAIHQHSVPVVFTLVADPVRTGMIESLARPGGNATGFTNFEFSIGGKWLELLKEISPRLTHVTVIANPANPIANPLARVIEETGRAISITVVTASAHGADDIQAIISTEGQQPSGGLIVLPDGLAVVHSGLIVELAERNRLPAVYPFRTFAAKGGLLTYGLDIPEIYRQAADYVDRILRGERPADLPVQAPTKFELVINLKTAKALNLTIPSSLLATADEVIE
jgi:putative tryptophan/tyrosine transport system substrate-binding protein